MEHRAEVYFMEGSTIPHFKIKGVGTRRGYMVNGEMHFFTAKEVADKKKEKDEYLKLINKKDSEKYEKSKGLVNELVKWIRGKIK